MTAFIRPIRALPLLGGLIVFLLVLGCTSADADPAPTATAEPVSTESPIPPKASPTSVASPTRVPSSPSPVPATPTTAPTTTTGISIVDRVMSAMAAKDAAQLASLAYLETFSCTTAAGLGGPPQCLPGEAAGTPVKALFTSSCDGHYIRQSEVLGLAQRFLEDKGKLAGVYRHNGLIFPQSQYVLVYAFDTPYGSLARVLFVSDPGIVGITFGCGTTAKDYISQMGLTDAILLPGG